MATKKPTSHRRGVIVNSYGGLWRLSRRNAKKLIQAIAAGTDYRLTDLGKPAGHIWRDVTDMSAKEAQADLDCWDL